MMTRLCLVLCVPACFGAGPAPSAPSEATILFALDLPPASDNCRTTRYIHEIALDADNGYAVTSTFLPPCNNGSTGNAGEALPVSVFQFPRDGGNTVGTEIGTAGMLAEGSARPRITVAGGAALWAFAPMADNRVLVQSAGALISGTIQPNNGANAPTGMFADATTTYVATGTNGASNTDPNHPRFPCCGGSNQMPPQQYGFFKLPNMPGATPSAMPVAPALRCEQMKDCIVANTSTLFYVEQAAAPLVATVGSLGKTASTPELVAQIAEPPVSIAADEEHVAWATSIRFNDFESSPPVDAPAACAIYISTTAAPHQTRLLLQTGQFSCMDVALDGGYVYFTVVDLQTGSFDATVIGRGIGRVAIDTSAVETLDFGITAPEAGPRQLFVGAEDIITLAPFAVASIRKTALEGHEDFRLQ